MSTHRRMDETGSVRPQITAELMARTGIDEAVLERTLRRFHDQVRADPLLGPVFAAHIADWPAHLSKMVSFWSSVALMTGQYLGAAIARHLSLPVGLVHFDRWRVLVDRAARAHRPCDHNRHSEDPQPSRSGFPAPRHSGGDMR